MSAGLLVCRTLSGSLCSKNSCISASIPDTTGAA